MKIAVLSGKGGTGKTFVSVNLASIQKNSIYFDCDVETPNGALFFSPRVISQEDVCVPIPKVNHPLCNGCRKCVDFCQYNALAWAGNKIMIFEEICHYCGGCKLVCPKKSITEQSRTIGSIQVGIYRDTTVISGSLNPGEISGLPVISQIFSKEPSTAKEIVIDCASGSSCDVICSIRDTDVCIIVAEPTLFGLHDLETVYQLVKVYNKPLGVVINKSNDVRNYIKTFCKEHAIKILAEIPYSDDLSCMLANGKLVSEIPKYKKLFVKILKNATAAYVGG